MQLHLFIIVADCEGRCNEFTAGSPPEPVPAPDGLLDAAQVLHDLGHHDDGGGHPGVGGQWPRPGRHSHTFWISVATHRARSASSAVWWLPLFHLGAVLAPQDGHGTRHVQVVQRRVGAVHARGGDLDALEHATPLSRPPEFHEIVAVFVFGLRGGEVDGWVPGEQAVDA